ncbi:potassium-transporting ATPase subunit KdpA [Leptospira interrogans]|uniref:Potassium-transporting ATPase potassium-binding subunit n=2 Tax=Leptospira interrogans TaxID=173 RepID=A0AA40WC80_LEPIR|nr:MULTISPECIES: potassium-transporting ATPase subunit KdpA [Leptospira]EMF42206.1 K+-transporting ATPase, A subunit [Leptospira interrogans serovar Lora str. TE 1992]AKH76491.1 ATPase [Leptospira interrogans serovar Bratislava]EJO77001.1 K+-transporting ATPase, A subunit [Leptospira interrogans serovar Pomona str. Kennewicki LC82-25]EKN95821.1 K+-transporting ATPase, A subunit [Leptospira interrogans serovar Pomona str. Pomona]EKR36653.1 K+-transporting ATPase, A subunit [Leptospira interroga
MVTEWIQLLIFLFALLIFSPLFGLGLYKVYLYKTSGFEKFLYKICGIDPNRNMDWKEYALSLLVFNFFGFLLLFLILFFQNYLPLNPENFPGLVWDLAFNTAVSFTTNTNWQAYSGESTLSFFSQMAGLTTQNFLSATTGLCVLLALSRGISVNYNVFALGNFWKDMIRGTLYVLLPLSFIFALFLVGFGVVQTFSKSISAITLEGNTQIIPLGPVASQVAIKQLGTNGGGYFGVNASHPFENPSPISNFLQMFSILILPGACVFLYGRITGSIRHAWAIFSVMFTILCVGILIVWTFESSWNPISGTLGFWEGKEIRFGILNSSIWEVATTVASNGSVNSMHDSFSPIGGLVGILNIQLGEIVFGGVGAGMYGMILFVLLTVFLSGIMVGRSPEYLGKKIEKREIQMSILGILLPSTIILLFTAISVSVSDALSSLTNRGPHGLSEILYAFSSGAGNNGSAFAGLNANTTYYNVMIAIAMILGRFGVILPVLVIAGSLAQKKRSEIVSEGSFSTEGGTFYILLLSVIIIVGALTFFPVLTIGPILEHFIMFQNLTF